MRHAKKGISRQQPKFPFTIIGMNNIGRIHTE